MADSLRRSQRSCKKSVSYTAEEEKHPSRKVKQQTRKNSFYECEVVKVDNARKMVKIHFTGYNSSLDEWQSFSENDFPVARVTPAYVCGKQSLADRIELFKSHLYVEVKKSLRSTRKDDPFVRLEINVQHDVFTAMMGDIGTTAGRRAHRASNDEMRAVLGATWDSRINNYNMDYNYVIDGSLKFWMSLRRPVEEYVMIGGKPFKQIIEQLPMLVLTFVRGRGNRTQYLARLKRKSTDSGAANR